MKFKARNAGFTLVELMVALLIGLLIMLGAGQLYLTGFRHFQDIEALSDRQAVLTYAADMLIRDIRRADLELGKGCPSREDAEAPLYVDEGCHYYGLDVSPDTGEVSLRLKVDDNSWQPVVSGFRDMNSFSVVNKAEDGSEGLFEITFVLEGESEIVFYAQNRTERF